MRKGTTPTLRLVLDIDTAYLAKCWVTLRQAGQKITKTGADVVRGEDGKSLSLTLTQEETLGFAAGGSVEVQLRAIATTGEAVASEIATVPVDGILMDGVIA